MPTPLTLRPGTPVDIRAIHQLDLLCFSEPYRFDLSTMRRYASRKGAIFLVTEVSSTLTAFVIVHLERHRTHLVAYVVTLDTHPGYRRQHLAQRLMSAAEQKAAHSGATAILLHVSTLNPGAIAFYESLGYARTGHHPNFYAPALHAWLYQKPLGPGSRHPLPSTPKPEVRT